MAFQVFRTWDAIFFCASGKVLDHLTRLADPITLAFANKVKCGIGRVGREQSRTDRIAIRGFRAIPLGEIDRTGAGHRLRGHRAGKHPQQHQGRCDARLLPFVGRGRRCALHDGLHDAGSEAGRNHRAIFR